MEPACHENEAPDAGQTHARRSRDRCSSTRRRQQGWRAAADGSSRDGRASSAKFLPSPAAIPEPASASQVGLMDFGPLLLIAVFLKKDALPGLLSSLAPIGSEISTLPCCSAGPGTHSWCSTRATLLEPRPLLAFNGCGPVITTPPASRAPAEVLASLSKIEADRQLGRPIGHGRQLSCLPAVSPSS